MRLQWKTVCDKNGGKTEPVLQYWDEEFNQWVDIRHVEVKTWEVEESNAIRDWN